jgi:hypothetical protein
LLEETEKGNADPMLTSRVLGVPVDDIDFPEPPSEEEMVERYEGDFGRSVVHWND